MDLTQLNVIQRAAHHIQNATALLITAGAGMGVDSGLPDFRGNEGFWKAYPALYGYPFTEMADPKWFIQNPQRAWGFYGHRLNLYRATIPHVGFKILHQWAQHKPSFIFTSNVDGQFQKAGFDDSYISECHGSIHWLQYVDAATYGDQIFDATPYQVSIQEESLVAQGVLPQYQNQLLRPNILMFGDFNWVSHRSHEQEVRLNQWYQQADTTRLVVIEMGAGTHIPTVRYFSERFMNRGATLIRINPRESQGANISIAMGASAALESIAENMSQL